MKKKSIQSFAAPYEGNQGAHAITVLTEWDELQLRL
jgi:hypothetical protein